MKKEEIVMEKYIGTKIIKARILNLGDYNKLRDWAIPTNEDPKKKGCLVGYPDASGSFNGDLEGGCDYISWSPKNIFDAAYKPVIGMNIGLAVEAMKMGCKVARKGWNGANMYVVIQKGYPNGIPINKNTAEATGIPEGTMCAFRSYLMMKTAVDREFVPWAASQSDMLAEDWMIV